MLKTMGKFKKNNIENALKWDLKQNSLQNTSFLTKRRNVIYVILKQETKQEFHV